MADIYSQKEEDTFRFELFRRMGVQDSTLKDILTQTTKTNGRVTVVETKTEDYDDYKKVVQGLSGLKTYIMGCTAVIVLLGAFVFNLISKNLLNDASADARAQIKQGQKQNLIDTISAINQTYNLNILAPK